MIHSQRTLYSWIKKDITNFTKGIWTFPQVCRFLKLEKCTCAKRVITAFTILQKIYSLAKICIITAESDPSKVLMMEHVQKTVHYSFFRAQIAFDIFIAEPQPKEGETCVCLLGWTKKNWTLRAFCSGRLAALRKIQMGPRDACYRNPTVSNLRDLHNHNTSHRRPLGRFL